MNIVVDLDGTILEFDMGQWEKFGHNYYGSPKEGAIDTLHKLRARGHRIIICTCRINNIHINEEDTIAQLHWRVKRILNVHQIPYDEIWDGHGKPLGSIYIDDRGFRLSDNWHEVLDFVDKLEEGGMKE